MFFTFQPFVAVVLFVIYSLSTFAQRQDILLNQSGL